MYWLDWILIFIPMLIVVYAAFKSQKYVKGVADFLSAGRIAGRYVVSVANGEAAMGLISVIAIMEMYYRSGFGISFWYAVTAPISMVLGLVGFCNYRFRETKAMTMGQFFEIRYNKQLRVVAAVIQSVSGIINYAIFPAVGARFVIYFLGLPMYVNFLGTTWSTFGLAMCFFLGLALLIACLGGQVTIMVTDCIQGLLSYPMYLVICAYFLYRFSWADEMAPALLNRAPGESFLNPYDVEELRDFNLFFVLNGILALFLTRMSWGGTSGYNGAAKSAHEAKMGGLLGSWRAGFSYLMYVLIAVVAFTYMNHEDFKDEANDVRTELATQTLEDVVRVDQKDPDKMTARERLLTHYKDSLRKEFQAIPPRTDYSPAPVKPDAKLTGKELELAQKQFDKELADFRDENTDPYPEAVLKAIDPAIATMDDKNLSKQEMKTLAQDVKSELKKKSQTFTTIYGQMLVPVAVREMLPIGLTGIFAALMIFLMISTDTTYMHSWGTIIVQDFIVPLHKKAFTPERHIKLLRIAITGVCVFVFLFSYYFSQIDFILMFFAITGAIWAGAGAVITFGLYWRKGTSAGAFAALISGAVIAIAGIVCQQTWASHIYPFLEAHDLVTVVGDLLWNISKPFHPIVMWKMNPTKFPINSVEVAFICDVITIILYVVVSLLTCKKPFNMERMLHRGIYAANATDAEKGGAEIGEKKHGSIWEFIKSNIIGIDEQYTKGDKVLAWSVFLYSFGYDFFLCFVVTVIWNCFDSWTNQGWSVYFLIKQFVVAGIIGLVSTFWFGICGTKGLFQLFRDLENKKTDLLDDGRVVDGISVSDLNMVEEVEKEQQND